MCMGCRVHTRDRDQALGALSLNLMQSSAGPAASSHAPNGSGAAEAESDLSQVGWGLQAALASLLPYTHTMAIGPTQAGCAPIVT